MIITLIKKKQIKPGFCEYCGEPDSPNNPVTFAADPYAEEIGGDDTPRWMCASCRQSSAWDI